MFVVLDHLEHLDHLEYNSHQLRLSSLKKSFSEATRCLLILTFHRLQPASVLRVVNSTRKENFIQFDESNNKGSEAFWMAGFRA